MITTFPDVPIGKWDLAGERFTTHEPYLFLDPEKGTEITVPSGFVTDFSSIPRAVWWWFAKTDYPIAGLVHDALYRTPEGRSRRQCDDIWRRILHLSGCRKSKRLAAWSALRAGGWVAWGNYREREQSART